MAGTIRVVHDAISSEGRLSILLPDCTPAALACIAEIISEAHGFEMVIPEQVAEETIRRTLLRPTTRPVSSAPRPAIDPLAVKAMELTAVMSIGRTAHEVTSMADEILAWLRKDHTTNGDAR